MVPHRSLNFTWHHFTLSLFFPPFFLAYQFSKRSTQIFHCFPIFSIVLYHSLSFFPLFFSLFSPPFPFCSHCFMSYSLIFPLFFSSFSIIFPSFPIFPIVLYHIPSFFHCFSHHFPLIAISPSPPRRADQGGIDTPPSPNCHLVHNPKTLYLWPPFLTPNFPIFGQFRALCPQTPLTHFVRKKNFA